MIAAIRSTGLVNAKTLLAAFNERGQAIDALLGNVAGVSANRSKAVDDNRT